MRSLLCVRALGLILAGALASTLFVAGGVAALEKEEWDQEDAARLAKSLHGTVEQLIATARVEDRAHGLSPKSSENYLMIQDLLQLKRHTARLSIQLDKGATREDTEKVFNRVSRIVTDVSIKSRNSSLLSGSQPEVNKAQDAFEELAAYYGVTPEYAPAPAGAN